MKTAVLAAALLVTLISAAMAQDPGWPRKITQLNGKLVIYQPQVDDWKNFTQIDARMAFQLTPTGDKTVVGIATLSMDTWTDNDTHTVELSNPQITSTNFPSLDPFAAVSMGQLVQSFLNSSFTMNMSLDRLVASVSKKEVPHTVSLKNDPPLIFISYRPGILLAVHGQQALTDVEDTHLQFLMNANWPVFFDKDSKKYYLFDGKGWLVSGYLTSGWSPASQLPRDMSKVPKNPSWADLKPFIPPPPGSTSNPPQVFYSNAPAEIIVFGGPAVYASIPNTQLTYATNTDSYVFVYAATGNYYYLTAGRWFSAPGLLGPWVYATDSLPPDFAQIPTSSPVSGVLSSVPGTAQAEDAVLIAQIPTTATINPALAAEKAKVSYYGDPVFKPIEGTSLSYAANTPDKVIQVGDLYYLCLQGVWFMSTTPQGPWQTASSVPQVIYTIPPSSPVYNVTYVTQVTTSSGVQSSYTAGYMGVFVAGAAIGAICASGTGYYYPPYIGFGGAYYPYASTYGYHAAYNPYTGAYGYSHSAYGPYGGGSYGASYNPYTGTYARGASTSTAYGKQSFAQAYNPYTGAYGATHQGSNAYSNWGSSVATRGNQSAYTQHYSDAQGSVGTIQGSEGGRGAATSTAYGNTYAGKQSNGDMYAGHDGNVYKNTGGGWQQYNNGSWNNVNKPTATATQQANYQKAQSSYQQDRASGSSSYDHSGGSSQYQSLDQEAQNRQRGSYQSDSFQNSQHSWGGGWGGGDHSWGGGGRSWGGRR